MRTAIAAAEPEPRPLVAPVLLTTGTAVTVGDPGLLIATTATATAHTWTAACAGYHGITEPCRGA